MAIAGLLTRPCTVVRRLPGGETDAHGNDIPATQATETVCELQRRVSGESPDDVSLTEWLLVLPAGTEVSGVDAVIVSPVGEFEAHGDPWPVRNPRTGAESHIELSVRKRSDMEDEGGGSGSGSGSGSGD